MTPSSRFRKVAVVVHALGGLGACAQLSAVHGTAPAPPPVPEITVSRVTLGARPSNAQLAAHYCYQAAGGGLAAMACRMFGSVPTPHDLQFSFQIELAAKNPSPAPMPVVALLVAFTAYPESTGGQNLGTACIQMCEDPNQCPQSADACHSSDPQVRGMNDFAAAAAGLLISSALSGGPRDPLRIPMVPAGGTVAFIAGLSLGVDPMLALMQRLATDGLAQIKSGKVPAFQIPWAIEGSAWVTIEKFGRIGAGLPRQTGIWSLK